MPPLLLLFGTARNSKVLGPLLSSLSTAEVIGSDGYGESRELSLRRANCMWKWSSRAATMSLGRSPFTSSKRHEAKQTEPERSGWVKEVDHFDGV